MSRNPVQFWGGYVRTADTFAECETHFYDRVGNCHNSEGDLIDRIIAGAVVKESEAPSNSKPRPSTLHRKPIRETWHISRVLATGMIVGALALSVRKILDGLHSDFKKERENPMSSPAKAEDNPQVKGKNGDQKSSLLETLLDQDRTVDSTTDDLMDKARTQGVDDFSRTFEKRVGGLSGFGAPLRPSQK